MQLRTISNKIVGQMIARIVREVIDGLKDQPHETRVQKRLYTTEEAGVYLGRSKRGMEHLVSGGKISSVKHDGRRLFDKQQLDIWIESGRVQ